MYAMLFHSEAAAPTRANLAAVVLRLSLAVIFLVHGLDKIINGHAGAAWVNDLYASKPDNAAAKPKSERETMKEIPTSEMFMGTQLAVSWGEFFGGLALLVGMLTRLAALGLIVIQIGAIAVVTAPRGFHLHGGGSEYEYNLALIVMCATLLILGAGRWSVDRTLAQRRPKRTHGASAPAPLPAGSPMAMSEPADQLTPRAIG